MNQQKGLNYSMDYERPTVEFMTPRNREEAKHLAGFITTLLLPPWEPNWTPDILEGVFGVQPYTHPVRYSGIQLDNDAAPVDDEDEFNTNRHAEKLAMGYTYTGWHVLFTYTDSMTNTFYTPIYYHQGNGTYDTWEM